MSKTYRLKAVFKDWSKRVDPKVFYTQKDARRYAIKMMDAMKNIRYFEMSNPDFADIWQVTSSINRTDDGKGFYWSALKPYAGWYRGSGHYINADGSISKKEYIHYW